MNANQTPTPWSIADAGTVIGGRDRHIIGEFIELPNARRIVACVNYCEGVSTAELEAAPKSVNLRAILNALDSAANAEEIVALLAKARP